MDLAKEIGKRLGMEVKIEALEFDSLIASLKQGKIDAVIACMSPMPEKYNFAV
ncbi:MAG TPA: transporter substrate-binding domain-containing protein [Thermoanaerobacterales bacterium]|nr:transporter substrate-binding domain-containing protein [Thermoanaerobacterales bacterium]